jgi:spore germination protein YaaH
LQNTSGEYNECIDTLISFVIKYDLTGIDIDFEIYPQWPSASLFNSFADFLTDLGDALHVHNKKLSVCAPSWDKPFAANPRNFPLSAFENLPVDYVMLMVYDAQDLPGRAPGTGVWPISWLCEFVNYSLTQLPSSSKIIAGIPSYGYHYDALTSTIKLKTYNQILEIISPSSLRNATRDPDSMELIIKSKTSGDVTVTSDQVSVQAKWNALLNMPIGGVAVWHLGGGNPWFSNETEETI